VPLPTCSCVYKLFRPLTISISLNSQWICQLFETSSTGLRTMMSVRFCTMFGSSSPTVRLTIYQVPLSPWPVSSLSSSSSVAFDNSSCLVPSAAHSPVSMRLLKNHQLSDLITERGLFKIVLSTYSVTDKDFITSRTMFVFNRHYALGMLFVMIFQRFKFK
jgi:hypothetical protein